MAPSPAASPWRAALMREVAGETLRPGGFTVTGRAVAHCRIAAGARVLDAGCGLGATAAWLNRTFGFHAVGVDLSPETPVAVPVAVAGIEDLPFGPSLFDAVFCECVLSLVNDPQKAVSEFRRVLAPGGWLALSDVYLRGTGEAGPLHGLTGACCLGGARSREETDAILARAGFALRIFEDHSDLLKQMAARLVFAGGSLKALWSLFAAPGKTDELACAAGRARPGFALWVAQRDG